MCEGTSESSEMEAPSSVEIVEQVAPPTQNMNVIEESEPSVPPISLVEQERPHTPNIDWIEESESSVLPISLGHVEGDTQGTPLW